MAEPIDPFKAQALAFEASSVFTPSAPINDKALFAGRIDQIRQVIDVVNQRGQHAIIFGERGVGKTSLANVLADFLSGGPVIVVRRINCDTGDSYDSVWKKIFEEIQFQQVAQVGGFGSVSQRPRSDAMAEIISPDVVRRQLTLWSNQSQPVLVIDEFDRIDDRYRTIFADTIKTLSDNAVRATVVFVGVADNVENLISGHESIQRALAQIKMPRMSEVEIREIITTGLTRLGMTIEPRVLSRIAVLSQGLPHYAHLLGLHSTRAALDRLTGNIDMAVLDTAIRAAVGGVQQSIRSAWQKATLSSRKDNLFADVLLACALAEVDDLGTFASQDVRVPMQGITGKPYDIPAFAQHLNEFSDDKRGNILKKIGGGRRFRYLFTNPLMPPYVIMRGFSDGKVSGELLDTLVVNSF
jgi:Cdc6-like AAA superfamily ATPase